MRNTFGNILRLTTFGESHGVAIGGVLDGFPAGVSIDAEAVQRELDRRRPGQGGITTARRETDQVQLLSGIMQGKSLGTPIGFIIPNRDARPEDYDQLQHAYRPSHADYTWEAKYGLRDWRGGGRASARETACRVVAGALAKQALSTLGIAVNATAVELGDAEQAKTEGDTLAAQVECTVTGVHAGLGEPVFGKLSAELAAAMMSINAAKAFEIGLGTGFAHKRGSEVLDHFELRDGVVHTTTNYSGGIQGGISNGEPIVMRVTFKPIATLMRDIATIGDQGRPVTLHPRGRHDVSVAPRVLPVVEAMAALVILDHYLLQKTTHL